MRHVIPGARAQPGAEVGDASGDRLVLAPSRKALGQFAHALGILQQEAVEIRGIPLGDAGRSGHDRRQTAAERLVDAETVGFVPAG